MRLVCLTAHAAQRHSRAKLELVPTVRSSIPAAHKVGSEAYVVAAQTHRPAPAHSEGCQPRGHEWPLRIGVRCTQLQHTGTAARRTHHLHSDVVVDGCGQVHARQRPARGRRPSRLAHLRRAHAATGQRPGRRLAGPGMVLLRGRTGNCGQCRCAAHTIFVSRKQWAVQTHSGFMYGAMASRIAFSGTVLQQHAAHQRLAHAVLTA